MMSYKWPFVIVTNLMQSLSPDATPQSLSLAATPQSPSPDATPQSPSPDATPQSPSLAATPQSPSLAATPQALSLAATPQSPSLAATPQSLWHAAQRGQTYKVHEWLQNRDITQDVNCVVTAHVKFALAVAVTNNHASTISRLLQKWRVGTDTIMPLLDRAVVCGCTDAMRALFARISFAKHVAGICSFYEGCTRAHCRRRIVCTRILLHRAIDETRPEILAYLAQEQGVDLNQQLTPLDYRMSFRHINYSPLTLAVRNASHAALNISSVQKKHAGRHIATVQALLRHKACVNNLKDPRSPLNVALKNIPPAPFKLNRHIRQLLQTLVLAKADVDALSSREKELVVMCC